jgi:hypothetical protein
MHSLQRPNIFLELPRLEEYGFGQANPRLDTCDPSARVFFMPMEPADIGQRIAERCNPPIKDTILRQAVWVALNAYMNKYVSPAQAIRRGYLWSKSRSDGRVQQAQIGKYFHQVVRQQDDAVAPPKPKSDRGKLLPRGPRNIKNHPSDRVPAATASKFFAGLAEKLE